MTRRHWRAVSGFVAGFASSAVVAVLALGVLGPKPGAPEEARTFGLGPLWLSRLESSEPSTGGRELKTVTNGSVLLALCIATGIVCAVLAGRTSGKRGMHG